MSQESLKRVRACIDLRNATVPLTSLVLRTTSLLEISEALEEKFGKIPDFFDQDPVILNLTWIKDYKEPIDFKSIISIFRQYKMQPIGAFGGNQQQMSEAREAGLVQTPAISPSKEQSTRSEDLKISVSKVKEYSSQCTPTAEDKLQSTRLSSNDAISPWTTGDSSSLCGTDNCFPTGPTVVIDKPLRSGQQRYARNANLVCLDIVNPGAEVIADGDIHVYGPLRGIAVAGAKGNTQSRIFTTCFEAQLVVIAGIYSTTDISDTGVPPKVIGRPTQVKLVGEKLIMELIRNPAHEGI